MVASIICKKGMCSSPGKSSSQEDIKRCLLFLCRDDIYEMRETERTMRNFEKVRKHDLI